MLVRVLLGSHEANPEGNDWIALGAGGPNAKGIGISPCEPHYNSIFR